MTHQSKKDYIEARLARDRAELKASVSEVRSRATLGNVALQSLELAAVGGWKSAGMLARGAKANPVGFGLISAGIAWIFFGPKKTPKKVPFEETSRWEDEGGLVVTPEPVDRWSDELDALRQTASDKLRDLEQDSTARFSDTFGKIRDFAAERGEVIKEFAADLNKSLGIGLEHLSEVAKAAAIKAREETYVAKIEAERLAQKSKAAAQDHPLITGVFGLGIGVALATMIPRFRSRGDDLSKSRDDHESDLRLREAAIVERERRMDEAETRRGRRTRF